MGRLYSEAVKFLFSFWCAILTPALIGVKFGEQDVTAPHWCNASPMQGKKPLNA